MSEDDVTDTEAQGADKVSPQTIKQRAEITEELSEILAGHKDRPLKAFIFIGLAEDGKTSHTVRNVAEVDVSELIGETEIELTDLKNEVNNRRNSSNETVSVIANLLGLDIK